MDIKSSLTVKNISFFIFIAFIIFCIVKMPDVAMLIFASYVISCSINPLVDRLESKIPRPVATVLVILGVSVVAIGVFTPIIITAIREIKEFITELPNQINSIEAHLNTMKIGSQHLSDMFNLDTGLTNSSKLTQEIFNKSVNFTMGLFGALTIIVMTGIIVFFLTNEKKMIKETFLKLFPSSIRYRTSKVIDKLEIQVGGYVSAQVLCMTQVGVVVAVGLGFLHVEYALFLGFLTAALDLIPIIGPTIAGVVILLIALPKGALICTLAVLLLLFAQFIENYWARPYFFSKYLDLHPLIVIFSFVLAAKLLGMIGLIFAPAIAAVLVTLFREVYIKTMNEE